MTNEKSSKQSKQYEKERRDRLNAAFDKLSSALPEYDPVSSLSKIDILTKALDYIQQLEADKSKPSESIEKSCEKENLCLKAKVKHLSSRIRQLMDVMYSAKIEIPENLPPTSTYTPLKHCKWNGKAGDKRVELLLKSICDKNKENKKNKHKSKQTSKNKQPPSLAKNQTRTSKLYRQKKRVIKLVENEDKLDSLSSISNVVLSIADINAPASETPAKSVCVSSNVVPLQENNSKNKIIPTNQSTVELRNNATQNNKLVSLISAPIMATGITSTLPIQNIVQNVNLGTYILPNGQLMSVQQQAPIIPQITPQFLINRPVTPVIVMQNNNSINNRPIIIKRNNLNCEPIKNNCRLIYPKIKYDSTRTTFSNQKPIPSLNLNFSSTKCSKQMRNERGSDKKRKLTAKENLKACTQKKLVKNNIKKRNSRKGKKINCKTDKENTHLKMKLLEKISLKRSKLIKKVRTKNSKNISNKFTNYGKVANGLLIKRSSLSNGCDFIRIKKANLGSVNRLDEASNAKTVENINGDTTINGDFSSQSASNFTSVNESSDFINSSKTSINENFSQKNILSDTFSKSLMSIGSEKSDCDVQMKINSSIVETSAISQMPSYTIQPNNNTSFSLDPKLVDTFNFNNSNNVLNQLSNYEKNSFLPILPPYLEDVREFPSDILSSLQIPSNLHNSESLSPTAAFLLSFPLVSTSKNAELLNDNESELSCENQNDNSTSILQIGNVESPSSSLIEGQAVLFDQQYTHVKSHWLPKSCDKIESNPKYDDSLNLSFENPIVTVHTSVLQDKKCSNLNDSGDKVSDSKIKINSSSNASCKDSTISIDKVSFEKKTTSTVLNNSDAIRQNSTNFTASHNAATCSTKEILKTTEACNNLLPVFSEVYCAKTTDRSAAAEPISKLNEKFLENGKKLKDKGKSKGITINPEAPELSSCEKEAVVKMDSKNGKDKVSSSENNSNNTKSHVNWMTAPDVRSHSIEQFTIPELFASQNFDFLATSSVPSASYSVSFASSNIDQLFEYSSTLDNNKLYNPNYPAVLNQTNVWSPSKSSLPHHSVGPHLDSNNFIIPSTLPTLIGDLALGTNTTPIVDAFKMGSFEMIPDNYGGQRIGEPLMNESQKSSNRTTQDHKTETNESLTGIRCKMKDKASDNSKNRPINKMFPFKKSEFNDKSQQTSATNFLSVSQLVEQNQVKSNETINENQFAVSVKRNVTRQKQPNKSSCSFYGEKQGGIKNRNSKKGISSTSNNSDENIVTSSNQRVFNQTPIGNKIDSSSSGWYQNQNQKEASLDTALKSNNYSAESLLNNDCHSQVVNYNPLPEIHSSQNCSPDKNGKLQPSSMNNYFIPSSQPHHNNFQQVNNLMIPSNTFVEPLQFPNQNYQPEASTIYEKNSSGYYSFVPSSQTCHASTKNSSSAKSEPPMNLYPSVTTSSATVKNSKEKRTSCKHAPDMKNQSSNMELNHGISSYINTPFTRPSLTSTPPTSNYLFTDPVYTNTPSSWHSNKTDTNTSHYSNENFLKPCVSISDYAPFDDCNFKAPQNSLSMPSSTSNSGLYLAHTSLASNALATNFKNKPANFPNFLTPVSTNSLAITDSNLPSYAPSVVTSTSTASTVVNSSNYLPSIISSSVSANSAISTYLPTFIGTNTSVTSTTSNYLSPMLSTSKCSKKVSSCSASKSTSGPSIANYLPPIISTPCITSSSKIPAYPPPVISTNSLVFSQNNSISNYLPSIISTTSSSVTSENSLTNYLPPVISTSNALGNSQVSNFLPPVLPSLNDASLYLPLNNTSNNVTGPSISAQYLQPSSSTYVTPTTSAKAHLSSSAYLPYSTAPSTNRNSSSSSQSDQNSVPPNQPYTSNVSLNNPVFSNTSSNYLPIFSSKSNNHSAASTYMPVFSNSTSVTTSSSSYLPIFSNSSSDLTIISSNYLPLPNCNQVHNSFPSLNTSYTSNYLPSSCVPSSNYFPVTLNSTVANNSNALSSTPNYLPNSAPFNITNAVCSPAVIPSSSYASSSSVPSRPTNKTCKTSLGSCKNYPTAKLTTNGSEIGSSEVKKLQSSKPSQDEISSKSSAKLNSSIAGTQLKSCNPCGTNKFPSSSSAATASMKTNIHEIPTSNPSKQSAAYEMPKTSANQQIITGNFEMEEANASFTNSLKVSEKTRVPTVFPVNSGSSVTNNFNCVYSTSDNISYQPINLPNSFQNRPEFLDPTSICPVPSFNNDASAYSVKSVSSGQRYVPSNEQVAYNAGSNSGSSSLTNFNLCAILPEMNDKLRCHNSINNAFNAQGVPEQASFGKFDFYQYPEKKVLHQTAQDKKGQPIQHVGQNVALNQPHLNNIKPASSLYQNNLETS